MKVKHVYKKIHFTHVRAFMRLKKQVFAKSRKYNI